MLQKADVVIPVEIQGLRNQDLMLYGYAVGKSRRLKLMTILFRLPVMIPLLMFTASATSWAQTATNEGDQSTITCHEGANLMKFTLVSKGHAKLTHIEGPDVGYFPDLHEVDWTVGFVRESEGVFLHIDNSRGARLSLVFPVLDKTLGRMTWNNPPNSKADILCDLHIVR